MIKDLVVCQIETKRQVKRGAADASTSFFNSQEIASDESKILRGIRTARSAFLYQYAPEAV